MKQLNLLEHFFTKNNEEVLVAEGEYSDGHVFLIIKVNSDKKTISWELINHSKDKDLSSSSHTYMKFNDINDVLNNFDKYFNAFKQRTGISDTEPTDDIYVFISTMLAYLTPSLFSLKSKK